MPPISLPQKLYFAAVGILALWVGVWGYFIPAQIDIAIPWLVPPLHARFLGAMYLSGATFMLGFILARRYAEIKSTVPVIAIWTGLLFLISLFYLDQFNFARPQVWIWFGSYLLYPLIALYLVWRYRTLSPLSEGKRLSALVRIYLLVQGALFTLLALSLLALPNLMVSLWPWKITPLLAQLYSAPFLAYGVVFLLASRRHFWLEVWVAVTATFVFVAGVLLASLIHLALFSITNPAAWLWFGGFAIATLCLALLSARALLVKVTA